MREKQVRNRDGFGELRVSVLGLVSGVQVSSSVAGRVAIRSIPVLRPEQAHKTTVATVTVVTPLKELHSEELFSVTIDGASQ
jgi:hypothetical protein